MRVIGGVARGHRLKRVPGDSTRPIMDRVKENLFNILGAWVAETRWLDLFAGTGQVGIEALSRGAEHVLFIDSERLAISTIHQNLAATGLAEGAEVLLRDAFTYLASAPAQPFDVIYVAPPQYQGMWLEVLERLDRRASEWLTADGMVVVQVDPKEYEGRDWRALHVFDQRRYGRTMLVFYELIVPATT